MQVHNDVGMKSNKKKRMLVLAPHQDDEIDLAAYALLNLRNWEKFILYSTNGDNKTPATVRFNEAIESARVLGVPKDNIVFLGYGDNQDSSTCIFFSNEELVVSAAGHTETYGVNGINDYHYQKHGIHSPYNYQAFKADLKEAVLDIKADLIICVDFDSHIDHRMLSLAFDEVMRDILSNQSNTYYPEIWKRFGYTMSYFAPEDYTPYNNKENLFPAADSLKPGEYNLIGKSLYQWDDRIRIPESGNKGLLIKSHKIVQALKCHVSQYALFRAFRMDNSDEVFWRKRTDNLALKAKVISSNGDATKLNDFKYYDVEDIHQISCRFTNDSWLPANEKPFVVFCWLQNVRIGRIRIYGSILGNAYEGRVEVLSDHDRFLQEVQILDKPEWIDFTPQILTTQLKIVFTDGFTNHNGIAEIEIYENKEYVGGFDETEVNSIDEKIDREKKIKNMVVIFADCCWMKIMRIRSYFINYNRLMKQIGLRAVVSKVGNRLLKIRHHV